MSNPAVTHFVAAVKAIADQAATATGLAPATVIIQWAQESGWSVLGCWQGKAGWSGRWNYGGIMDPATGKPADFTSPEAFVQEYIRIMQTDLHEFGKAPAEVPGQLHWLGTTNYNGAHHYDGVVNGQMEVGGVLLTLWQEFGGGITAALAPAPAPTAAPTDPDILDLAITVAGYGTGHLVFRKP